VPVGTLSTTVALTLDEEGADACLVALQACNTGTANTQTVHKCKNANGPGMPASPETTSTQVNPFKQMFIRYCWCRQSDCKSIQA